MIPPNRLSPKPKESLPKRPLSSPKLFRLNKKSRLSLHDELEQEDTRSFNLASSDDDLPASAYFHKGKKRVGYGLFDDEDISEDKHDYDNSINQPSTSTSKYANSIPQEDDSDNIFNARSTHRPKRGLRRLQSSSPEPENLTYSFRGAKCAFPNPYKDIPPSVKRLSKLDPSHVDFLPTPNPKPKLLFADAHRESQVKAQVADEKVAKEKRKSMIEQPDNDDELEEYQLDDTETVTSKKRSATSQQPPVTPRPHKLLNPTHKDLLASAKKSNKRAPQFGNSLLR